MIVGVLSDTHGKAQMAASAVKLLLAHGAEYLIHCGDVGDTDVLDSMAGHPSMVCGKPSVSSVCYNELVPCLTER